jgi:hypothetical protein
MMMNPCARHVIALLAACALSLCLLCSESKAQDCGVSEPPSGIPNCDVYQRCINSCAELVRSFGAEEITPEQFKARMDKVNEELQTNFAKELKSSHDTGKKFSPEEQATLGRLLEDIFNWTVAQTILRTRIAGSAPPTQRQLEEMREDMKATEDSLRAACPNITIPQIQ